MFRGWFTTKKRYPVKKDALLKQDRKIFYSICEWGFDDPETRAKEALNSRPTTGDIFNSWSSMIGIIDQNDRWWEYAGPGGWNDSGMLEVGNGGMTVDVEKIHFALWCVTKAPLLIGCDITKMSKDTFDILTNEETIDVNQDSLGVQGKKILTIQQKPSETPKTQDGSKLYVSSFSGGDDQKWSINSDGSIIDVDKKFCLDIPNYSNNNIQVEVYKCHI